MRNSLKDIKWYLVRNDEGRYYRAVGIYGYGSCWTNDVREAASYRKIAQAKARVTWFATNYPDYPVCDIVEVAAGKITILPQKDRINERARAKEKAREANPR